MSHYSTIDLANEHLLFKAVSVPTKMAISGSVVRSGALGKGTYRYIANVDTLVIVGTGSTDIATPDWDEGVFVPANVVEYFTIVDSTNTQICAIAEDGSSSGKAQVALCGTGG